MDRAVQGVSKEGRGVRESEGGGGAGRRGYIGGQGDEKKVNDEEDVEIQED